MEINIIKERENPLLSRDEIKFECLYPGESTPSIPQVKNKLVAILNSDKNLLIVDTLKPCSGEGKAEGYAKVYKNRAKLEEIEPQHIIEKNLEITETEAEEEEE